MAQSVHTITRTNSSAWSPGWRRVLKPVKTAVIKALTDTVELQNTLARSLFSTMGTTSPCSVFMKYSGHQLGGFGTSKVSLVGICEL